MSPDDPPLRSRAPENIAKVVEAFGVDDLTHILSGDVVEVEGIEFVCSYEPSSTPERFYVVKSPELVDRYLELCGRVRGGRIMELGIAEGGSTAMMALAARPERLVAVDLETQPLDALTQFIEAHDLAGVVRPCYGIDQADRETLGRIARDEFDGELIDVVVDDCSHQLRETRISFETLFPRLRPGGVYLIEDWNADHLMREAIGAAIRRGVEEGDDELRAQVAASITDPSPETSAMLDREPLSRLVVELMLARAVSGDAIEEVVVDEFWITVRRGPGELDDAGFRLDQLYTDHFGLKSW